MAQGMDQRETAPHMETGYRREALCRSHTLQLDTAPISHYSLQ